MSEQYKNVDTDEYRRMKEEKKQFQQQISSLKTDNQKMRTQAESLKSELSKTQGELVGLRVIIVDVREAVAFIYAGFQAVVKSCFPEFEMLAALWMRLRC